MLLAVLENERHKYCQQCEKGDLRHRCLFWLERAPFGDKFGELRQDGRIIDGDDLLLGFEDLVLEGFDYGALGSSQQLTFGRYPEEPLIDDPFAILDAPIL